jgi:hypothetical protein
MHATIIDLMKEAARTSKTFLNFYQTTWSYNPENSHLQFACYYGVQRHEHPI